MIAPVADCTSRRGGMGHYLFARSVLTRERKVLPMTGPRRLIIKKQFHVRGHIRALFDAYVLRMTGPRRYNPDKDPSLVK